MKNSSPRHLEPHKEPIRIMTSREKTLKILQLLRRKSLAHQKDYQQIVQQAERLLLKSFFLKICNQKKEFAAKLQQEIEKLEKELTFTSNSVFSRDCADEKCTPLFKTSMHERHGLIKECYRREKRNINLYDQALSLINEGVARELLLSQKAKTKSWLREIKCMGIRIYEDVEGEKHNTSFEFDLN